MAKFYTLQEIARKMDISATAEDALFYAFTSGKESDASNFRYARDPHNYGKIVVVASEAFWRDYQASGCPKAPPELLEDLYHSF